jgi:hypothetical protein
VESYLYAGKIENNKGLVEFFVMKQGASDAVSSNLSEPKGQDHYSRTEQA